MSQPKIESEINKLKRIIAREISNNYHSVSDKNQVFVEEFIQILNSLRKLYLDVNKLEYLETLLQSIKNYQRGTYFDKSGHLKKIIILVKKLEAPEVIATKKPKIRNQTKFTHSLNTPLEEIKGIGVSRIKALHRLNLKTVNDLLQHYPRNYIDRREVKEVKDLEAGKEYTVLVELVSWDKEHRVRNLSISRAVFKDNTGYLCGVWFNQAYMLKNISIGEKVYLSGKVGLYRNMLEITSPDYELYNHQDSLEHGRLVPVYNLTTGINQKFLRKIIYILLEQYPELITDPLPDGIIEKHCLYGNKQAFKEIHFPENNDTKEKARYSLIFRELFTLQLRILLRKEKIRRTRSQPLKSSGLLTTPFIHNLPFQLTEGQTKAIEVIKIDMEKSIPMNRLLHGEVGSGKTVVAIVATLLAIENEAQAVLIAPTEILATQHFNLIQEWFDPQIETALLTGSIKGSRKKTILEKIEAGAIKLVIGTHALLEDPVIFQNLGLIIIDEQHRFGVSQRWQIKAKGSNPHLLVMSATPIPRTLTLTLYGDLEVSTIKELPSERGKVKTTWYNSSNRAKVYDFIKKQIAANKQGYIICPIIEESEKFELTAVKALHSELKNNYLKDVRLEVLHGKLPAREIAATMSEFKAGKLDVLVATSMVEVGVDVKNANFMVIEDAHRFGLSQLHQLRGRIRRGKNDGFCFLISDPVSEESIKRLKTMVNTEDGFLIAEEDLKLRGTGELVGYKQHGLSEFKIANPLKDLHILEKVKLDVEHLLEIDPLLITPEHQQLREMILQKEQDIELIGV